MPDSPHPVRMFVNGQAMSGGELHDALADGTGTLSMVMRAAALGPSDIIDIIDITAAGGWRAHLAARGARA